MRNTNEQRSLHRCLFIGCQQRNWRHDCNRHRIIQADPVWGHPDTRSSDVGEMDFSAEQSLSTTVKNRQGKKNTRTNLMPS